MCHTSGNSYINHTRTGLLNLLSFRSLVGLGKVLEGDCANAREVPLANPRHELLRRGLAALRSEGLLEVRHGDKAVSVDVVLGKGPEEERERERMEGLAKS